MYLNNLVYLCNKLEIKYETDDTIVLKSNSKYDLFKKSSIGYLPETINNYKSKLYNIVA